jgi:trehalose 6-phosphate synthase
MVTRRRLIVVSNRGPVRYELDDRGAVTARRGAGGLVTALRPLVSHHSVTWIASAMSDSERELAAAGPRKETSENGSRYRLRLVAHDPRAYHLYYDVVANPTLWFLQHGLWPELRDPRADLTVPWRDGYRAVNASFAEAVLDELARDPDAAVLFQDYHLYLAPRFVRARAPGALLSHFVHVPWVDAERWSVLQAPLAREIHEGLLANDVIGFHTRRWRDAFLAACGGLLGADAVGRAIVEVLPISVDPAEFDRLAESAEVRERERGLEADRPERLIVRVDRTDPSKNVVRGIAAYAQLLARRADLHGRVVMLALLDPSRQEIAEYRDYRALVERSAEEVNARFGRGSWQPLRLEIRDDFALSVAAYKQYDVLLVNPVKDGMNLVAKEAPLVNRRDGVLVLSREAGAFEELGAWVEPVEPFDVEQQADALERALELPAQERRHNLREIGAWVREHDLERWANAQLDLLEQASSMRAEHGRAAGHR